MEFSLFDLVECLYEGVWIKAIVVSDHAGLPYYVVNDGKNHFLSHIDNMRKYIELDPCNPNSAFLMERSKADSPPEDES